MEQRNDQTVNRSVMIEIQMIGVGINERDNFAQTLLTRNWKNSIILFLVEHLLQLFSQNHHVLIQILFDQIQTTSMVLNLLGQFLQLHYHLLVLLITLSLPLMTLLA